MEEHVYTLFGMVNEPCLLKAGEFGHDIIGVYTTESEAREIAMQPKYIVDYNLFVIYRSTVGVDRSSREVWRWVEDPTLDQ